MVNQISRLTHVSWFDGPTTQAVTLLNVDLSTVTTAADVVFGIGDPLVEILHLDAQAGPSATKHLDVLAYNVLLHRQYRVSVRSIVLLLREQAVHPNMTGRVQYGTRPERGKMEFGFEVIRLWEIPAEQLVCSSLATAPLAVLGKLPETLALTDGLAAVVRQLAERLERESAGGQADRLMTAAYVLTGLRLKAPDEVRQLFQGVSIAMRESVTYQAILEEGRKEGEEKGWKEGQKEGWKEGQIQELHRVILRLGQRRFGEVDEAVRLQIEAIRDIVVLEDLTERLLIVSSWDELMA